MTRIEEYEKQADEIEDIAKKYDVERNYFFVTTFTRYRFQLRMLHDLQRQIEEEGFECKKQYVKGRENVYASPAVKQYNAVCSAADGTVKTLMQITKAFGREAAETGEDPLLKALGINNK